MIKIFMSVRNRLSITKKALEALERHTVGPYQLYVYNNNTTYLIDEHFDYFKQLYKRGKVAQVCFTTDVTTFNAFSKASTCNFFGLQHNQDPKKLSYEFLVMMDNDMIVMPEWDQRARIAWKFVKKNGHKNIFVISQLPGGIKHKEEFPKIPGLGGQRQGRLGGSGFWTVQPDFFDKVGFLDIPRLVNQFKKHDQCYWGLLQQAARGKPYILGVRPKFALHCGPCAGSVCNRLTRNAHNKKRNEVIRFEKQEENLGKMSFEEFWNWIKERQDIIRGW